MNPRRVFVRKIVYLVVIGVLLAPLYWLSQPATGVVDEVDGVRQVVSGSPGGKLAQLRTQYKLSEAEMGDLDPTSETMKLSTFGMRGVASLLLWSKAFNFQKKKDWTSLSATLNQIAKLEPHYVQVWIHQGWNLTYNVSAQFDDFRERYHWVIEGIEFLKRGVKLNRREPKLVGQIGWETGNKIGRADESEQFRKLFKEDDDFHAEDEQYGGSRPMDVRDNWLVGKYWYKRAEDLVDGGASLKKTAPVVFFAHRPMWQMNYAAFLEKDGIFGDKAPREWKRASEDWEAFGSRQWSVGQGESQRLIRLNDKELYYDTINRLSDELKQLAPGIEEEIVKKREQALTDAERQALDTPADERTPEQHELARKAATALHVTPQEIARRLTAADRQKALDIAKEIDEAMLMIRLIGNDRQIVNFEYWRMRAHVEQQPQARDAREFIYLGDEAARRGDLVGAKENYDKGFAKWRELFDTEEFSFLVNEKNTLNDLKEMIDRYRDLLEKRDEPFPEDFILQDVVEAYDRWRPDDG